MKNNNIIFVMILLRSQLIRSQGKFIFSLLWLSVVNETLVRVMIDDMESLDDLVDSSVNGNARSLLLALNKDVLGQIAMFLKPADVYSLSLTCKHFKENGKLMMRTMIKAQLDCVMEDRTKRLDQTGTLKSFTFENVSKRRPSQSSWLRCRRTFTGKIWGDVWCDATFL